MVRRNEKEEEEKIKCTSTEMRAAMELLQKCERFVQVRKVCRNKCE